MEFARRRRKEPGRWLVVALLAVVLAEVAWAALDEGGIEIPADVNSTDVRSPVKDIHVRRRTLPAGLSEVRACQNCSGSLLGSAGAPVESTAGFFVPFSARVGWRGRCPLCQAPTGQTRLRHPRAAPCAVAAQSGRPVARTCYSTACNAGGAGQVGLRWRGSRLSGH